MMYTGELAVIPSLVDEVANAAKFLGFQEAFKGCEVYMRLHKSGKGISELQIGRGIGRLRKSEGQKIDLISLLLNKFS